MRITAGALEPPPPRATTTRNIFVTGTVASSLGKGLTASSLVALLKAPGPAGHYAQARPVPERRPDPGTMNPFRHGEVSVTNDGAETDLDTGHSGRGGGTVGDIESQPFLEIVRQVRHEVGRDNVFVGDQDTLLPACEGEVSARGSRSSGIRVRRSTYHGRSIRPRRRAWWVTRAGRPPRRATPFWTQARKPSPNG
ncbi:hypothetical protein [Streptomyces iranensis]|uniref:hypothetical protein n=1 Tax=Streptomyces iranensis TaxID=576784 RepID=UPI003557EAD1